MARKVEYMVIQVHPDDPGQIPQSGLNAMGKDGWILCDSHHPKHEIGRLIFWRYADGEVE